MTRNDVSRTHEPSLREVTVEVDGLRELMESRLDAMAKLAEERDKWYTDRDEDRQSSVDKALTAQKEQTASSFSASKEAILKAEEAQKSYNTTHNDLSRKLDEQNKMNMPRPEAQQRFDAQAKELAELKQAVGIGGGIMQGGKLVKDESRSNIALGVSIVGALIAAATVIVSVVLFVSRTTQ
jgi:phosphopantetheinyl transferase (holo-ACP synthase)